MVGGEVKDDELLHQVYSYLVSDEYPEDANESKKRVIRKKAKKFLLNEELFYRQGAKKHKVSKYKTHLLSITSVNCIFGVVFLSLDMNKLEKILSILMTIYMLYSSVKEVCAI